MMNNNLPLHLKYRPKAFAEVVGHTAAVKALADAVKRKDVHTFLLTGPSGVGKTTLARIAAHELGCDQVGITELDAATYTGIDEMRTVQKMTQHLPIGKATNRAFIIDESHGLSKQAWTSLLKVTEEPPPFVFWFFCTTDPQRVPKTMATRSLFLRLGLVSEDDLGDLFDRVCEAERVELTDDIAAMIIREAQGSPRQMLVNLAACRSTRSSKDAKDILKAAVENEPIIELCRFLAKRQSGSWARAMALVEALADENPESVRIIAMNYFGKAVRAAKSDADAVFFLQRLEAFGIPYHQAEGHAPLLRSIGQVLFSGE